MKKQLSKFGLAIAAIAIAALSLFACAVYPPLPEGEKTTYTTTFRQPGEQKITSSPYTDSVNPGFNIAVLKAAGYKKYTLKIVFDIREQNNGTQRLKVRSGGSEIGSQKYDHGGGSANKNWISGYTFSGTYNLVDTSNNLTLEWDSPKDNWLHINTWYLGNTQVTVTAQ